MHVHDYEKLWLGLSLLLIVALIGAVTYGAVGAGVAMVDDSHETVDPDNLNDHPRFGDTGVHHVEGNQYDVNMLALQFAFLPTTVEVPAGSEVTFYVTSPDVIHGMQLEGTNVNTMVIPGEVAEITVEFDEPGEYGIVCNEFCGAGHHDMEGLLTVVPEDEYDDD